MKNKIDHFLSNEEKPVWINKNNLIVRNGKLMALRDSELLIGWVKCPQGITEIAAEAFSYCFNITKIDLSDDIKKIGNEAFKNSSISCISLPQNIHKINYGTFSGCIKLNSISLPENVKYIDEMAFSNCLNLTHIFLPAKIEQICSNAFYKCPELKYIIIENGNDSDFKRICNLLPESLQSKVISKNCYMEGQFLIKEVLLSKGIFNDVAMQIYHNVNNLYFFKADSNQNLELDMEQLIKNNFSM